MPITTLRGVWKFVFIITLMSSHLVFAQFYTFESNKRTAWETPSDILEEMARTAVSLVRWSFHDQVRPEPLEKYIRDKHFGNWVDDKTDDTCFDTRNKLLVQNSLIPVTFNEKYPCKVVSGEWLDPYSGTTLHTVFRDIEVDHVVALKNAYDSGAWNWDYKTRCLYANFTGYENHLLVVSMPENRRKGAKGPEQWMPSDQQYACQHLQNWLAVKMLWNLSMTQDEAVAIESEIQEQNCDPKMFQFSKTEIARIRRVMQDKINLCR